MRFSVVTAVYSGSRQQDRSLGHVAHLTGKLKEMRLPVLCQGGVKLFDRSRKRLPCRALVGTPIDSEPARALCKNLKACEHYPVIASVVLKLNDRRVLRAFGCRQIQIRLINGRNDFGLEAYSVRCRDYRQIVAVGQSLLFCERYVYAVVTLFDIFFDKIGYRLRDGVRGSR